MDNICRFLSNYITSYFTLVLCGVVLSVSIWRQFGMCLHGLFWSGYTFCFWGWVWRTSSRINWPGDTLQHNCLNSSLSSHSVQCLSKHPEHHLGRHFEVIYYLLSAFAICHLCKSTTTSVPSVCVLVPSFIMLIYAYLC